MDMDSRNVSPALSRHAQGSPISAAPQVRHNFEGDPKVLNGTFESRADLRKALSSVQQALHRLGHANVQVVAEVKFRVGGLEMKEHVYSVTVTDEKLDADAFAKMFTSGRKDSSKDVASSPAPPATPSQLNGRSQISARSQSQPPHDDVEVTGSRPAKKLRLDSESTAPPDNRSGDTTDLLQEAVQILRQRETLEFMKQWHVDWTKQGGWLYDTLNRLEKTTKDNHTFSLARLQSSQDVLGQSINAASASTMAELANIAKLIPWLEQCRKTSADRLEAREEKWRTSSATFHDNARRDRENAERSIHAELEKHRALLIKIAEANGVDIDESERDGSRGTREASLGAQLTAELNMEASHAEARKRDAVPQKPPEPIALEDEDGLLER